MNSSDKSNVLIVLLVSVVSLIGFGQISSCKSQVDLAELETINKAIEAGIDPIAAKCAIAVNERNEDVCLVIAVKSESKKAPENEQ